MRTLFVPFEKQFDTESSLWCLTGQDSGGQDFGVAVGANPEAAAQKLREWVLDSLSAAADDGDDRLGDLMAETAVTGRTAISFSPLELIPIRIRLARAKRHLTQAQLADRLGITQQAYGKLEKPGANLQIRTIQQVEQAVEADLLEYV